MKSKKKAAGNDSSANLSATNVVQNNPEQRNQMISIAAYFRSEKRDFHSKDDLADWLESEGEIDRHLNSFSS
jgi:hypothetical protein